MAGTGFKGRPTRVRNLCCLVTVTLPPVKYISMYLSANSFPFLILLWTVPFSKVFSDTLMATKGKIKQNKYNGWNLLPFKNQTQHKWLNIGRNIVHSWYQPCIWISQVEGFNVAGKLFYYVSQWDMISIDNSFQEKASDTNSIHSWGGFCYAHL